MIDKIKLFLMLIFLLWAVGAFWQAEMNPLNWFTKVEPGQVWIWDDCEGDPFDCNKKDTIWIKDVRRGYVNCLSKPWFGNGKIIQITYEKTLFNQTMFYRIK